MRICYALKTPEVPLLVNAFDRYWDANLLRAVTQFSKLLRYGAGTWLVWCAWIFPHYKTWKGIRIILYGFAIVFPIIALFLWDAGRKEAINLSSIPSTQSIEYTDKHIEKHVTILKYLDKGPLFLANDGRVSFVPWSEVSRINNDTFYKRYRGLLCTFFRWQRACPASLEIVPGLLNDPSFEAKPLSRLAPETGANDPSH